MEDELQLTLQARFGSWAFLCSHLHKGGRGKAMLCGRESFLPALEGMILYFQASLLRPDTFASKRAKEVLRRRDAHESTKDNSHPSTSQKRF